MLQQMIRVGRRRHPAVQVLRQQYIASSLVLASSPVRGHRFHIPPADCPRRVPPAHRRQLQAAGGRPAWRFSCAASSKSLDSCPLIRGRASG